MAKGGRQEQVRTPAAVQATAAHEERLSGVRLSQLALTDVLEEPQQPEEGYAMTEHRLFDPADPPEWLDPEWWRDRPHCDHLDSPTGAHAARLRAAASLAAQTALIADYPGKPYIVDLGAGDGALLSLLPKSLRSSSYGYDAIKADVRYAIDMRAVEVHLRNVAQALDAVPFTLPLGPVVVLTEVLEHMADPHGFLAKLHEREEVQYVVASSPWKETPEKHEWNHAWCWDVDGYTQLFEDAGFDAVQCQLIEWSQLWLFEAVR